ncbi:hydantoinase/oxoprolinase family protein [Paenibacillus sp. 598K]|uniref:hydantoinase/oxoprolinase family protein n=1 Tax=Paenibacillus sp. 598K TaxID=1117987 RepID=UPI001624244E|nr:hydantoinase/oxoprolinase family protein [Paenibacillus sp. 598K]
MNYYVAVDSGGTFSDCVVIGESGEMWTGKAPSTPPSFQLGVVDAVRDAASVMGMSLQELLGSTALFSHGTTVATNALLTRQGCRTAVITTRGHEDAILIGRTYQKVAGLSSDEVMDYSRHEKATPAYDPRYVRGVVERVDYAGNIVVPLSMVSLAAIEGELEAAGIEAVAVSLLWSFANPQHERQIRDYLLERHPQWVVTLSSELTPVIGEYERTATTAINAYLSIETKTYMNKLKSLLAEEGYRHRPLVMKSSGGIASIEHAMETPVALLTSGPAGGVMGAATLGGRLGQRNILTTDVGGTSFDVGMIVQGEPVFAQSPVFSKYQVTYPMIEVDSIGAGGGSIAWVEEGTGLLKVGPRSAGAVPGPVCYGRGGTQPTVTDANLVLGRMNPDFFLGGKHRLDAAGARRSMEPLAARLGIGVEELALGIVEIADSHMGDLVRKMSVEKGYDPASFALYAFGGAGPLHVCGYTRGTGIETAVIPPMSSVFSAYGIVQSDPAAVAEETLTLVLPCEPAALASALGRLQERALAELRDIAASFETIEIRREVLIRYQGQKQGVPVACDYPLQSAADIQRLMDDYDRVYEQQYGKGTAYRKAGLRISGLRVKAAAVQPPRSYSPGGGRAVAEPEPQYRDVYYRETGGWRATPFYVFDELPVGFDRQGPAIIISNHTTIYVAPDYSVRLDEGRNLVLTNNEGGDAT